MSKYVRKVLDDYCVLDLETTGLDYSFCEIIEVGILKVQNNTVVEQFSSLVKPQYEIDEYITALTGITNEMLATAPTFSQIKDSVLNFIGQSTIVGHNTSFDIRFLNKQLSKPLDNEYMDTLQFSRKLFPELKHHRLKDLTEYLNLSKNNHRSIADCQTTYELYERIKSEMKSKGLSLDDLFYKERRKHSPKTRISNLSANPELFDEDNLFYDAYCCFTGKLEKMTRKEAAQIVANIGGHPQDSVTQNTNYLILGSDDFLSNLKNKKTTKWLKAEKLKADGYPIEIISEKVFYDNLDTTHLTLPEKNTDELILGIQNLIIENIDITGNIIPSIFKSKTGKWFSIKIENQTLVKFTPLSAPNKGNIEIQDVENGTTLLIKNASFKPTLLDNIDLIKKSYRLLSSESNDDTFGCCSAYTECSDAKKCIRENNFSRNCIYRKNLEAGKIFYGKNRNID